MRRGAVCGANAENEVRIRTGVMVMMIAGTRCELRRSQWT